MSSLLDVNTSFHHCTELDDRHWTKSTASLPAEDKTKVDPRHITHTSWKQNLAVMTTAVTE
jgi:hypothetical protein